MITSETILEFNTIKAMLCDCAVSDEAKAQLSALTPGLSLRDCRVGAAETTGARHILDAAGAPPLPAMKELGKLFDLTEKGSMLTPEELEGVVTFLTACKRLRSYLTGARSLDAGVAAYAGSIQTLDDLKGEISQAVQNGAVLSSASPMLRDVRRKIENQHVQVKRKLEEILRGKKNYFSDGNVALRNGRFVLSVKKEYKNQVPGSVVDISGTGSTYFIEPAAVSRIQDELNTLRIEEDNEVRKVLYTLTALVEEALPALRMNREAVTAADVAFAKGRLSANMHAVPAELDLGGEIVLTAARHPLLDAASCVPLTFRLGGAVRGVVITGPNTGGKTVTLKTVGLLSLMAQCGLHVPAEEARFPLRDKVLCDVGDGQSITENLSTFSAHISNVISILNNLTPDSLVLLDELGSGTDPAEGMGIAISVLEELRHRRCLFVATTHYPEVKEYAQRAEGLLNARMAFDRESLRPLYRLELGEAGESCALSIAQRLGFPAPLLTRAKEAAYGRFLPTEAAETPAHVSALRRDDAPKRGEDLSQKFTLGDSVLIGPEGVLALVFRPADHKGMVGVQVKGVKSYVNHTRLTLKTPASELYPPDYDFSIIFDSVDNRKARHQMERAYTPGLTIEYESADVIFSSGRD